MTGPDPLPLASGRFLYHANYYDGPRSGAMQTGEGKRFWFDVHPDSDRAGEGYWYLLYDLTEQEWEIETARQDLFRKYVGTHNDYDENGRRDIGAVQPKVQWDKFYGHPEIGGYRMNRPEFDYPRLHPAVAVWDPRGNRPAPVSERTDTP